MTIGIGLLLGATVVASWRSTWGKWDELRRDWLDFRAAAGVTRAIKEERAAFANGKRCSGCRRKVNPRRLYRAVRTGHSPAAPSSWVYRCPCGESTLYDGTGRPQQLKPASAV